MEEAVRQYGNVAAAQGFDVQVVSVGPVNEIHRTPDGITARFFKQDLDLFSNPVSISLARQFFRICRRSDLLHFHFPWPTAELLSLVAESSIKKALVTFHCDIHRALPVKRVYLPFIRRFLSRMDRICVTSRAVYDTTPYLGSFRRKIEEIPLFINEQRFAGMGPPDDALIQSMERIAPFALFVGVLRWYKGLDVLLDAARNCAGHIVIVGKGPFYDHLARRIRNESLDRVHLLGFQPDRNLVWLIRQCRMIVLPSITPAEAFGQILLEGLYFGKPLISTELGTGTSQVNQHGVTGLVIRPGCSRSLVLAMNALYRNAALAHRFGRNARYHYMAGYTPRVQGDKYVRLYKGLLQT
jgi:rhamnosyl/mannosyltransferase